MMRTRCAAPLIAVIGACLIHAHLYYVQVYASDALLLFLWVGGIVSGISVLIAYKMIENDRMTVPYALATLFIVSFSLRFMYSTRFAVLNGIAAPDVLYEYGIAKGTMALGRWQEFNANRYASVLSVTLLPALLSEVSGLNLDAIFKVVFVGIGSAIPILLFIVIGQVFEDVRIPFLSALLLSVERYNFDLFSNLARQEVAEIFLLVMLYSLLRRRRKSFAFGVVAIVSMFGIVVSHYYVAVISIPILLVLLIAPKITGVLRKGRSFQQTVSTDRFLWFVVLAYGWFLFVSGNLLGEQVELVERGLYSIVGGASALPNYQFSLVAGSPRGPIITGWFDMINLMIVAGLVYCVVTSKDSREMTWSISGILMLSVLGLSFLFPIISRLLYPARVYGVGFIFFSAFLALLLVRMRGIKRAGHIFRVFFIIFIVASVPMNMLLPNTNGILLYHPESMLSSCEAARQTPRYQWSELFSRWIDDHVSSEVRISVDILGFVAIISTTRVLDRPGALEPWGLASYPQDSTDGFLMIHEYYLHDGIWVRRSETLERVCLPSRNVTPTEILRGRDVVYSDSHFMLLCRGACGGRNETQRGTLSQPAVISWRSDSFPKPGNEAQNFPMSRWHPWVSILLPPRAS